jgi:hypothetical protein
MVVKSQPVPGPALGPRSSESVGRIRLTIAKTLQNSLEKRKNHTEKRHEERKSVE